MTTLSDKVFGTYLGLEFKEDSLVITYLKNSLSGLTLLSSSTFPLRDHEIVSDEIREYIAKQGLTASKVFVGIPDKWAITGFINVPSMKGKGKGALDNLMRFEIERHIPFRIGDVAYDFLVMDEKDATYSIVFVAVHQEKIDYIKEFLAKLSIRPHAVTISSFALLNAVESSDAPAGGWREITGIVGKSDTLGKKGETNISLYVDGINLNTAIIKNGLCTHLKSFLIDESQPPDIFLNDVAQYLAEMQSALAVERFNKLLITGNLSSLTDLPGKLKEKLGVNIVPVDQTIKSSGNLEGTDTNSLSSSIGACFTGLGIGTYKINLLPHKTDHEIKTIVPLTTRIFLVLILVLVIGIFTTGAVKQKRFLEQIEETLKKNEPEIKALEKLQSDINLLKQQSGLLNKVGENEITLEILAELTRILPKESWVTNLHYKGIDIKDKKRSGGEIVISGYADSSSSLIPLLEDSPYFEKVEFVGSIKKTRDKEQFKLSAKIVRPEDREAKKQNNASKESG